MKKLFLLKTFLIACIAMIAGTGNVMAETETFTMSAQGYTASKPLTNNTITGTNLTLTFAKNDGSTAPSYYSPEVRLYAKGSLTVTANEGCTITEILIGYTNGLFDDMTGWNTPNWTGSSNSVVFTVSGSSKHVRISSITVTYTAPEGGGVDKAPETFIYPEERTFEESVDVFFGFGDDCDYPPYDFWYTTDGSDPIPGESAKLTFDIYECRCDGVINITETTTVKVICTLSLDGELVEKGDMVTATFKKVIPGLIEFSSEENSFKNAGFYGTAATKSFIAADETTYSFTTTQCMLGTGSNAGELQMKKNEGTCVSPVFEFANGYTVNIEYTVGSGNNPVTISSGDLSATGTTTSASLEIPSSSASFTITTGASVAYISRITIVPNAAPEEPLTFTIGESGYATFYTDKKFVLPKGVEATVFDCFNPNDRYLSPWTFTNLGEEFDRIIPAGVALLLKGEPGTYEYQLTDEDGLLEESDIDNLLHGADAVDAEGMTYVEGVNVKYYILSKKDGKVGFYWAAENGGPVKYEPGKAFLALDFGSGSKVYSGFALDEGTTGISVIENIRTEDNKIYSLKGVYMGNDLKALPKGLYIVNGKKVAQ